MMATKGSVCFHMIDLDSPGSSIDLFLELIVPIEQGVTMSKILNHWTGEAGVALIAGVVIAYGMLIMTIGFHDYAHPQEDSQVVWTCATDGNGECGPDSPKVQINLHRLMIRD